MNRRVVITGLGVISPNGVGIDAFWKALVNGKSGISEVTRFDTSDFPTHLGGQVKDFDPSAYIRPDQIHRMGRGSHFGIAASMMALDDAGVNGHFDPERTGVSIGTTTGEAQVIEALIDAWVHDGREKLSPALVPQYPNVNIAANVATEFGIKGPIMMIPTACAAGNYAIGYGFDLIRQGSIDMILAGGTEPFSRVAFAGFNRLMALAPEMCQPFDRNRKGMMVSEGAAMIVLESSESATKRDAKIYAEVLSYGLGCDAYHMTSPHPQGKGAIRAMESALQNAGLMPDQVDYVNAHGTGTPANDKVETFAIKKVFGDKAARTPVSSIKSMIGHTMGAASAIEAAACALVISEGIVPPTINYSEPDPECDLDYVPNVAREVRARVVMSNSFAFGGNCATLLLGKIDEARL